MSPVCSMHFDSINAGDIWAVEDVAFQSRRPLQQLPKQKTSSEIVAADAKVCCKSAVVPNTSSTSAVNVVIGVFQCLATRAHQCRQLRLENAVVQDCRRVTTIRIIQANSTHDSAAAIPVENAVLDDHL